MPIRLHRMSITRGRRALPAWRTVPGRTARTCMAVTAMEIRMIRWWVTEIIIWVELWIPGILGSMRSGRIVAAWRRAGRVWRVMIRCDFKSSTKWALKIYASQMIKKCIVVFMMYSPNTNSKRKSTKNTAEHDSNRSTKRTQGVSKNSNTSTIRKVRGSQITGRAPPASIHRSITHSIPRGRPRRPRKEIWIIRSRWQWAPRSGRTILRAISFTTRNSNGLEKKWK